ncbi:MAG: transposase [Planctomycetes bacterium]|nr:transposase [Planctomycetota bacterium]
MKNTPNLYDTLFEILGQHFHWKDIRHLHTLLWMIIGLLNSKTISLPEWATFTDSRARFAQSTVRRFSRWLHNQRIKIYELYGPIIADAISDWGNHTIYLALDTTMLWNTFCQIRLSVIYRGRAVPILWKTIKHGSSTVAFIEYRDLLNEAKKLLPLGANVIFLADRGFADTELMEYLSESLHWHWRIRIKSSFLVFKDGKKRGKTGSIWLRRGQALFLQKVQITKKKFGPVYLALAKPHGVDEDWFIVSDQPTSTKTFEEYGLRFDIEENFLDDKSNGFQLESSSLRSAKAISRLTLVLAVTTLFLVSQGTEVVSSEKRRYVDAHWFRGNSYLKIGWKWVQRAFVKGYDLITKLALSPLPDPEPAMAYKQQAEERKKSKFSIQTAIF